MCVKQTSNSNDREELQQFADWLLELGDGRVEEDDGTIELPREMCEVAGTALDLPSLVEWVFPDLAKKASDAAWIAERAILAPLNATVDKINAHRRRRSASLWSARLPLSVRSSLLLIFLQPSRASPLRRIQHSRLTHWCCACRHSLLALGLLRLHLGIPGFQWWLVHAQEVEAYIAVPLEYDGAHSLLLAEL